MRNASYANSKDFQKIRNNKEPGSSQLLLSLLDDPDNRFSQSECPFSKTISNWSHNCTKTPNKSPRKVARL